MFKSDYKLKGVEEDCTEKPKGEPEKVKINIRAMVSYLVKLMYDY